MNFSSRNCVFNVKHTYVVTTVITRSIIDIYNADPEYNNATRRLVTTSGLKWFMLSIFCLTL